MLKRNLLIFILLAKYASAVTWHDLWFNHDQQGIKLLEQKHNADAAKTFTNSNWKGVAYYRNQQYSEAYAEFKHNNSAQGLYNQGNALANMQKYQEAITAYTQALQQQKNFPDAEYNRNIVQKLLEQQSKSPQQASQNNEATSPQQQSNNPKEDKTNSKNNSQNRQENSKQSDTKAQNQQQNLNQKQDNAGKNPEISKQQQSTQQSNNPQQNNPTTPQTNNKINNQQQLQNSNLNSTNNKSTGLLQNSTTKKDSLRQYQDQQVKSALSQVPDDPGGLLRNKFLRDYQTQQQENNNE